ncbi:hypothetical protein KUTeg_009505 [Tegillarca granosa]|uniref:Uncharacterized protein n=1 Tax=Tegillarca granosa TaxID=220873 RepID=A0ABQ9F8C8_TEGGR|nr:hypothetical protein KUTeg_009505 [Tegillarca granosa]
MINRQQQKNDEKAGQHNSLYQYIGNVSPGNKTMTKEPTKEGWGRLEMYLSNSFDFESMQAAPKFGDPPKHIFDKHAFISIIISLQFFIIKRVSFQHQFTKPFGLHLLISYSSLKTLICEYLIVLKHFEYFKWQNK